MPLSATQSRFSTGVYGVVGRGIGYSLSPYIFRTAFHALGWGADYALFDIEKTELSSLLDAMQTAPIRGLSVTKPYKQTIIQLLDRLDDSARAIGAVNTVVHSRGRLIGYNTDVDGVFAALSAVRTRLRGGEAVIFGAGGGARAVAFALLNHLRMGSVTIAARRSSQAKRMIHELQDRMPPAPVASAAFRPVADLNRALSSATLIVNATTIGTDSGSAERVLPQGVRLRSDVIGFDLVYRPRPTLFSRQIRAAGARTIIDGWSMLVAQADSAFALWTGRRFPTSVRKSLLALRQLP